VPGEDHKDHANLLKESLDILGSAAEAQSDVVGGVKADRDIISGEGSGRPGKRQKKIRPNVQGPERQLLVNKTKIFWETYFKILPQYQKDVKGKTKVAKKATKEVEKSKEPDVKKERKGFLSKILGWLGAGLASLLFGKFGIKGLFKLLGKGLWGLVKLIGKGIWGLVKLLGKGLWKLVKLVGKGIWSLLKLIGTGIFKAVRWALGGIGKLFSGMWSKFKSSKVWKGLGSALKTGKDAIKNAFTAVKGKVMKALTSIGGFFKSIFAKIPGIAKLFPSLKATGAAAKGTTKAAAKAAEAAAKKKAAGKAGAKAAGKGFFKSLLKKIPIVGAIAGVGFGVARALKGDFAGAAMEVASGVASTIPGAGTAASIGIDAALIARDVSKAGKVSDGFISKSGVITRIDDEDQMLAFKKGGPIASAIGKAASDAPNINVQLERAPDKKPVDAAKSLSAQSAEKARAGITKKALFSPFGPLGLIGAAARGVHNLAKGLGKMAADKKTEQPSHWTQAMSQRTDKSSLERRHRTLTKYDEPMYQLAVTRNKYLKALVEKSADGGGGGSTQAMAAELGAQRAHIKSVEAKASEALQGTKDNQESLASMDSGKTGSTPLVLGTPTKDVRSQFAGSAYSLLTPADGLA
tara:strand:- start:2257 stop:4161 length:1905 start_codon:yes stop_codon:yes gene_type:complete